ncbi:MAG: phosphate transporter, permease protein PstA [Myxococcaceae bacterium]|nr:phosphate transporter, permease protein PstA [Myxococcaceae bacterium]
MSYRRRKITDAVVRGACLGATLLAIVPLVLILFHIATKGAPALDWNFFTQVPKPPGETGGGMANAIVGTLTLVALACAFGVPLGVLGGVYLAEFGQNRFGRIVRFATDVMAGVPSIVAGLFVYTLVVVPMHRFSAIAGGLALAVLMLPTVTRTTEELIKLVPDALREAALALGVPKWRAIVRVVLRTAAPGIVTGVVLAVARVTGETAPLLFTALNNNGWAQGIDQPTPSLTIQIYQYAGSPYEDQQAQAWGAALVLVVLVLFMNITARFLVRNKVGGAR